MYKIYTDGATSKNGETEAIGGWAFIIIENDEVILQQSGKIKGTTNNVCEMSAILFGCQSIASVLKNFDLVEIYSDSAYCINCVNQGWYKKWQDNGWINSSKQPVANKELWEKLIPFFNDVRFKWIKIKGHNNDVYNTMVDKMAVKARLN